MRPLGFFIAFAIAGAVVLALLLTGGEDPHAPPCDGAEVQSRVRTILADLEQERAGGGAAEAIHGVSETGYDAARDLRSCTAVAKFADGGSATLSYTTEWEDRAGRRFAVMLQPYER